jgi:carbon monoxide dehydrogenase subunit G
MQLDGSFQVPAPRLLVWEGIRDPALMAACVPGCQSAERITDTSYRAVVTVKFGPISATFNLVLEIEDEVPPTSLAARVKGEEGSRASTVSALNTLRLSEAMEGTQVDWSADVAVAGRLGKYGLGLMRKKIESLSADFTAAFAVRLAAEAARQGAT